MCRMPILPLWMCTQQQIQTKGILRKKQLFPCLLLTCLPPAPSLHCLLHLAAGQAIHSLPTTVARVLLSIPSPFLSPGDFATGPSTLLRQEVAHYCRNLLRKDSRGPTQHTTMGSSSSVHHTAAECSIFGATVPSQEELPEDSCWSLAIQDMC